MHTLRTTVAGPSPARRSGRPRIALVALPTGPDRVLGVCYNAQSVLDSGDESYVPAPPPYTAPRSPVGAPSADLAVAIVVQLASDRPTCLRGLPFSPLPGLPRAVLFCPYKDPLLTFHHNLAFSVRQ